MLNAKKQAFLVIGPCLFLLSFFFLADSMPLSGAVAVGLLMWMVFWWVTSPVDMAVTALLPIAINAVFAIIPMKELLSNYISESIVLIFGAGVLSTAWKKTGLDRRVALNAVSLIGPSMASQITVWFLASVILSSFMPNVAVCALYCPIAVSMLYAAGYRDIRNCPQAALIFLAIGWGSGIGGAGSPLGGAMNITAISSLQEYMGCEFMYIDWVVRMIPYLIIVSTVMLTALIFMGRKCSPIKGTKEYFVNLLAEMPSLTKDEAICSLLFIFAIIFSFIRPLYAEILPIMEPAYIFLAFCLLTFLIHGEDKRPLVTWEEAQKNTLWGMIILFGGGVALGKLVTGSDAADCIVAFIRNMQIDGGITTILLFSVGAVLFSEFTSSTVSAAIMTPIVITIISGMGLNPIPYWFATVIAFNSEFLLPISVRAIPVSYGLNPDIMLKKGIPFVLLRLAVGVIYSYACIRLIPAFGALSNWSL